MKAQPIIIQQLLEYSVFFNENADEYDIEQIISSIPRSFWIKMVGVLSSYNIATIDKLDLLFSSQSVNNRLFVKRRIQHIKRKYSGIEFIFCSDISCLEILRYAFSTPFVADKSENSLGGEKDEMLLLKLLLLINEKIVKYNSDLTDCSLAELSFLTSVMNPTVKSYNENEKKDRAIFQLEMARLFFGMFASDEKYSYIYQRFLQEYGINQWQDYVLTLVGILCMINCQSGCIKINQDKYISTNVLNSIALHFDEVIKYSSEEPNERNSNTDYRVFRNKPIIVLPNGDFFIFNIEFLIDKLFNSLYYEFKDYYPKEKFQSDIKQLFTKTFCEQLVLNFYLGKCIGNQCHEHLAESNCKIVNGKNKIGPPDYIILTQSSLLLFECKDIRINGEVLESHNLEKILQAYRNKFYKKDCGNNKYKNVGITQLTEHIRSVREGAFSWVNVTTEIDIYPVLIISDYKNIRMGFSKIANQWYETALSEKDLHSKNNKPLIVMSFITLFKYNHLFKEKGFEYYFDEYFKYMDERDMTSDISNFDDFMSYYHYELKELGTAMIDILHAISANSE